MYFIISFIKWLPVYFVYENVSYMMHHPHISPQSVTVFEFPPTHPGWLLQTAMASDPCLHVMDDVRCGSLFCRELMREIVGWRGGGGRDCRAGITEKKNIWQEMNNTLATTLLWTINNNQKWIGGTTKWTDWSVNVWNAYDFKSFHYCFPAWTVIAWAS